MSLSFLWAFPRTLTLVLHYCSLAALQLSHVRLSRDVIRTAANRVMTAGDQRSSRRISLRLGE